MQAELAHASRVALLGELSASLAHELKQPLAAILSNAQAALRFLNDDPADVNEVRDILKDIAESDRRASEIISRMRTMMKKGETQMERARSQRGCRAGAPAPPQRTRDRATSPWTRNSRPTCRRSAAITSSCSRCCSTSSSTAATRCTTSPPDERRLVIETARDGDDLVRVSVTDRGAGIAPEMLEHIFEPFYSTKDSGLGMGLAICRAIIKAHGGRLWAANNPDRGATFHFTLALGGQKQP